MKRSISIFFATGFGSGFVPKAPGTAGAAVGLVMLMGLNHLWPALFPPLAIADSLIYLLFILVFTLIGVWSADNLAHEWGKDPSRVVIDEMVGIWITFILVPLTWSHLIMGFIFFRVFDIYKTAGVRRMEELRGGWGVMMDDVLAGVYACAMMHILIYLENNYL